MHTPDETLVMIRRAIKELRDDLAGNTAAQEQIGPQIKHHEAEIERLTNERYVLMHDGSIIEMSIDAHERAESVFIEHAMIDPRLLDQESELDVPDAMPEPTEFEPEAKTAEVAPETEPETEQVESCEPQHNDPSKVRRRLAPHKRQSPGKRPKRPRIADGDGEVTNPRIDINNLSERLRWRADLVFDLLREHGALSQYQMAVLLASPDMLDCKLNTAQANVSEALQILQHERKVMFTGLKVPSSRPDRNDSPEWKVRSTPQEHSSAGIPEDDEAEPKTTNWPSGGRAPKQGSHISMQSGGFESKRGKH